MNISSWLKPIGKTAITATDGEMFIKSTCKSLGRDIFKQLRINTPDNINNRDELIEKLELNQEIRHVQMSLV